MHIITDPAKFPASLKPSAITIGKFDGVHIGHRALIDAVNARACEEGLSSVIVTFDRHPMELFAPDRAPKPITSLEHRMRLLAATGVDAVVVLPFTRKLSELSPAAFIEQLLIRQLGMRALVIGDDFRFGHRGAGDVTLLRSRAEQGAFELEVLDPIKSLAQNEAACRASSTAVRELLAAGKVRAAAQMLQRNHSVRGTVVHGAKRGRELGFPTANLSPRDLEGFIPADGVYSGIVHVDDRRFPAAISIGNNPTFDGVPQQQIEAHLLDTTLDLYGKLVTVEFVDHIRPMVRFDSMGELIEGIQQDIHSARAQLVRFGY